MSNWQTVYQKWLDKPDLDDDLYKQLLDLKEDEEELEDSFSEELEFGTAGMRGKLGPGTNRLNMYTVRKVAEGLAGFIADSGEGAKDQGVVIAYDGRYKSNDFAFEAAKTLGYRGIRSYVFASLRPTPELSFAVRHMQAKAGIMITASHNPPAYNGIKVYGEDGGQIISDTADSIVSYVNDVDDELNIPTIDKDILLDSGMLEIVGEDIDDAYLSQLHQVTENHDVIESSANDFHIIYTPLHGTGLTLVKDSLQAAGFKHVHTVAEQELPDPEFSTVSSPNPEDPEAFELAIRDGKQLGAQLLIATDPDADRMGAAVREDNGEYRVLSGNEIGALMLDYLLSQKYQKDSLPSNGAVYKTIVTSELGRAIAQAYGIEAIDTLTGFKYIAEQIEENSQSFLFGYEESFGYLVHDAIRDKDAIQASMLLAETATYYYQQNMTLTDALESLYKQYGYYQEDLSSLTLDGQSGNTKIEMIMNTFRQQPPETLADRAVLYIDDYYTGEHYDKVNNDKTSLTLPASNVLKYYLENDAWICLRPSGTEPKIKFYFGVKEETMTDSREVLQHLKQEVIRMAEDIAAG